MAWLPLFEEIPLDERGKSFSKQYIINRIINHPPNTAPDEKTLYSDLGYILLAHVLERTTNMSLPEIIRHEVTAPLGLGTVHYRPLTECHPLTACHDYQDNIAPTETCPWRRRTLCGEVHDDNAWTMGGVAGHAGLFGSAEDIARFGEAWIRATDNGVWLDRDLAVAATSRHTSGRGLGWDFKTPGKSSAGTMFSDDAYGHLGFTGCSLWVDPVRRLSAALLTNRVYLGRDNAGIQAYRPMFHDLLAQTIGNFAQTIGNY
jgi:CubicO group peptidase (beta-lactamase class C family)